MKATFEHPDFPKGQEFSLPGMGMVENGKEFEVTSEMEDAYELATGKKFGPSAHIKVGSTKKGGDD